MASVAGNDPSAKNLDNDTAQPFVAVKITVAHRELHMCPLATCAGAARAGRCSTAATAIDQQPFCAGVMPARAGLGETISVTFI